MSEVAKEFNLAFQVDEWHFRLECAVRNVSAVHMVMECGHFGEGDLLPALYAAGDYLDNLQREFRGMLDSYFAQVQEEEKRKEAAQCPQEL